MAASISIQPVIMAGGSGTRLWPLSRAGFPKQFLSLGSDDSLFQQAVARLVGLACADIAVEAPLIVGNAEHRFLALEQLREKVSSATSLEFLERCYDSALAGEPVETIRAFLESAQPVSSKKSANGSG